jgi:predicted ribonuclease toxin of YeeF-YezG toxin-antitoxin module
LILQGNVRKYLSNFGAVESDHMTITIFKSEPKFEIKREISHVFWESLKMQLKNGYPVWDIHKINDESTIFKPKKKAELPQRMQDGLNSKTRQQKGLNK